MANICNITRHFNSVEIKQRKSDGYLDATAMCKATGKKWSHYHVTQPTQEFLEALSLKTGIPIYSDAVTTASEQNQGLIQSIKGGIADNQGTWVHPKVAIHLAQWCSPKFAVMVSDWVFELLTTGRVELQPQASQSNMLEHAKLNIELMKLFGIKSNMQTLALNNAMQKKFGVNLLDTWGMDGGLKAERQEQLYTVTELAKKLGVSRTAINPILIELGLQTGERDHKEQIKYKLTDKGYEYGVYLDVGKQRSDGTPIRQIKCP
jgi:DNA-binding XRE family transcriptional regulator